MALSIDKPNAPVWCLGAPQVTAPGTPVRLTALVDANNNNAPETAVGPGTAAAMAYSPTGHRLFIQGVHPAANNNGMVQNTGLVYLMKKSIGDSNRSDAGAMCAVIFPGSTTTWPGSECERNTISPYSFYLDADTANDGALCMLQVG